MIRKLRDKLRDLIMEESDEELREIYKLDVVDCHPFDTPVPITYEEWLGNQIKPWSNRVCSECKTEYYRICPFNGVPQPYCDEPRMKKGLVKVDSTEVNKDNDT